MAGWGMVAVMAASAAASIYANSLKGGQKTPGTSVGGEKKAFEIPDLFKNKGGSLMGGGAAPNGATPLSQKLEEPATNPANPPQFGPAGGGAFDELKRQQMLNSLMGGR